MKEINVFEELVKSDPVFQESVRDFENYLKGCPASNSKSTPTQKHRDWDEEFEIETLREEWGNKYKPWIY